MNPSVVSWMLALRSLDRIGDWVFVPGANCSRRRTRPVRRHRAEPDRHRAPVLFPFPNCLALNGALYALAATAQHALARWKPA